MPDAPYLTEIDRMFIVCRDQMAAKPETADHLINRVGIPHELVKTFAVIGVGRVRDCGEWFDLDPTGVRRLIIAVRGSHDDLAIGVEPHSSALVGEVLDLVAVSPSAPMDWLTYYGVPMLGTLPSPGAARVPLWPHPLAWARAGGHGVCILERDRLARMNLAISMRSAVFIPPAPTTKEAA
jgi:hypothetical protein